MCRHEFTSKDCPPLIIPGVAKSIQGSSGLYSFMLNSRIIFPPSNGDDGAPSFSIIDLRTSHEQ